MFSSNNIWVTKHKYNLFPQLWNTELFSATPPPAAAPLPSNGYGDINLFYGCFFNSLHFTTSTPFIEVKCSSFYSWELKSKSGITELKSSGILWNLMQLCIIQDVGWGRQDSYIVFRWKIVINGDWWVILLLYRGMALCPSC